MHEYRRERRGDRRCVPRRGPGRVPRRARPTAGDHAHDQHRHTFHVAQDAPVRRFPPRPRR